jgi:uncharacterized damage-inducible protein DinB
MSLSQSFLSELDHEAATTRKCLERIPDDKLSWKPHEKSMTMGQLATHIAEMANWAVVTAKTDEFDMNPPGGQPYQSPVMKSTKEVVSFFDKNVAEAKTAISGVTDDSKWMETWTLKNAGQTAMAMPRIACMRSFVLNHIVHHRGQLSVYLRENDIPVPSIYGPSADEGSM